MTKYKSYCNNIKKKIDEQRITKSSKTALYDLVEEFFLIDYYNISKKRKEEIELEFEIRRLDNLECNKEDLDIVHDILSQIKNSLFTILDQSVDKSNPEKVERECQIGDKRFGGFIREKTSKKF